MTFESVLGIILPIVYIVVGLALVWFVIELVMTIRKARSTVSEVSEQIKPTLDSVQTITANIAPVTEKIDPLVDRVSLTVDAANLEILRVDQILENTSHITGSVSNAVDSVGVVTNAPVAFVNSVADRMRKVFKRKDASDESIKLGSASVDADKNPVRNFVDTASDVASEAFNEQQQRYRAQKAEQQERRDEAAERTQSIDESASQMADAILEAADDDAPASTTPAHAVRSSSEVSQNTAPLKPIKLDEDETAEIENSSIDSNNA